MDTWCKFNHDAFNCSKIRIFDTKGTQAGLVSGAGKSCCGKIRIPIKAFTEDDSRTEEFKDKSS